MFLKEHLNKVEGDGTKQLMMIEMASFLCMYNKDWTLDQSENVL